MAGLIFEEAMQSLLQDEWLKQFKFLGKVMSQYISVCVNEGVCKVSIIHEGFNYERWKKTTSKNRQVRKSSCSHLKLGLIPVIIN